MVVQPKWDLYESVYLLRELIRVLNGEISRGEAVDIVSKSLRERAVKNGERIDDYFRNKNGVALQMSILEYIYTGGKKGLKKQGVPKLFKYAVDIYRNDKEKFEMILEDRKDVLLTNSVEEVFYIWLSGRMAKSDIDITKAALREVEFFCIEKNILCKPLLETVDMNTLSRVYDIVEHDRNFRFNNNNKLEVIRIGMKQYISFVKTHGSLMNCEDLEKKRKDASALRSTDKDDGLLSAIINRGIPYSDLRAKGGCLWIIGGKELNQFVKECATQGIIFTYKEFGGHATSGKSAWWTKSLSRVWHNEDNKVIFTGDVCADSYTVEEKKRYEFILSKYFSEDGYQLGRAIFKGRFKRYYVQEYGVEPEGSEAFIDKRMKNVGIERNGRIFPKQDGEQNNLLKEIIENIMAAFEEGATRIYIEAVFSKYQLQLAESLQIYNMDELAPMLLTHSNGKFTQKYSYLVKKWGNADSASDILRIMQSFHEPQNYEAIHKKAWYIPYDKMKTLLVWDKSIVNVAPESYFYAPNLPVSASEIQHLISVIRTELEYRSHITDVELMDLIQTKCPSIAINTDGFTTYGLRNCLGYILKDQFSFNGPIISPLGKELSMSDVYAEFARTHEELSFEDLKRLSSEMNIGIYWDSVLEEMVRISDQKMVRRDRIDFDVDFIDNVLDGMCPGQYVSIKDINLFLQFPNIGFAWNHYVLESYLFKNSRKFKLLHVSFGQNSVCGAMVRADSPISDYRTLIVDALSRSNALGSTKTALQYIVDHGYQQRRRYDGIEQLIQEAKLIKEQRENEEK